MLYIHNLLFELHGMVSNEMTFNLLCGEILPSSAHNSELNKNESVVKFIDALLDFFQFD